MKKQLSNERHDIAFMKGKSNSCESLLEFRNIKDNHSCENGSKIVISDLPSIMRLGFVCRSCHQSWSIRLSVFKKGFSELSESDRDECRQWFEKNWSRLM